MSLCVLTQCLCFILLKSEFRPNLQLSFHKRYTHLYKRTTEKNKPISLAFCSRLKNHISRKRTVKTQRKASIAEGQTMYFLDPHFLSLLGSPVLKSIKVRARKSRWPPPTTQDFLSTPNLTVQQYKKHTHTHTQRTKSDIPKPLPRILNLNNSHHLYKAGNHLTSHYQNGETMLNIQSTH